MGINKGGRKATLIPNLMYALNLSNKKKLQLIERVITEKGLRIDPLKILEVVNILTNEETDLDISLELSTNNLIELGLARSTAYKYVDIIKRINDILSTRNDVLKMDDWTKSRLYSAI